MTTEKKTWPGWECVRKLGSGAYGTVYEIQRVENGVEYKAALKVISIPHNRDEVDDATIAVGLDLQSTPKYYQSIVDNIKHEVELLSTLKGRTNIVSYEDHKVIPHEDGIGADIYIRMELLTPLYQYMKSRQWSTMPEQEVVRLGCDICKALEICEKKQIIHRDIKPENIFVNEDGDFVLGDFGIARTLEKSVAASTRIGTESYMAPEVFKGQKYDSRADIYSLGLVLYRFLNKNREAFMPLPPEVPQATDREQAFERRIKGEQIPAPADGSSELKKAILNAVAYCPEDRYKDANEFWTALRDCVASNEAYSDEQNHFDTQIDDEREQRDFGTDLHSGNDRKKSGVRKVALIVGVVAFVIVIGGVIMYQCQKSWQNETSENTGTDEAMVTENQNDTTNQIEDADTTDTQDIASEQDIEDTQSATDKQNTVNSETTDIQDTGETESSDEELTILYPTNLMLVGDEVAFNVKSGSWILEGQSNSLHWDVEEKSMASISSSGVLEAFTAGTINFSVEYEGQTATGSVVAAEVDTESGMTVEADTQSITLSRTSVGGESTATEVTFTLIGDIPEHWNAYYYKSPECTANCEWLTAENNTVTMQVEPGISSGEGVLTVFFVTEDEPEHVLASCKINIKIV